MLIIISQVVLLLIALALPLKNKRERFKKMEIPKVYKIDTDTRNANYAVNEFGTLERINRANLDEKPEIES